jgi:fructan beta-fructosidase
LSDDVSIDAAYFNLPIKRGSPKRRLRFAVEGVVFDEFEIELADDCVDYWVSIHVGKYRGRKATFTAMDEGQPVRGLSLITQADRIMCSDDLYHEDYRPQFHYSARRGWTNDVNGLLYSDGVYHLFYQHNPYGCSFGNLHWGHAISGDLVHWEEQPVALYPKRFGDWRYSGCGFVDRQNSLNLKGGKADVLVLAHTSTARGDCLSYSLDGGSTWMEHPRSPVIAEKTIGGDPTRVFWHSPSQKWILVNYRTRMLPGDPPILHGGVPCVYFYSSRDLLTWEFMSSFVGFMDCPDFFELKVDDDPRSSKWVLLGGDGAYLIGYFDGTTFKPEIPCPRLNLQDYVGLGFPELCLAIARGMGKHQLSHGDCFYASQTWSDLPESEERCLQIAWARVEMPGMPFNQMMTFPCELRLGMAHGVNRVYVTPAREIERLHEKRHAWSDLKLPEGRFCLEGIRGELSDIRLEFEMRTCQVLVLRIGDLSIVYDGIGGVLSCKSCRAPLESASRTISLQILVDRTLVEIYANRGEVYMPVGAPVYQPGIGVNFSIEGANAMIRTLEVFELSSIWGEGAATV